MRTGEVALKEVFVLDSAFSQPQVVIALDIRRVGRPACLLSAAGPWEETASVGHGAWWFEWRGRLLWGWSSEGEKVGAVKGTVVGLSVVDGFAVKVRCTSSHTMRIDSIRVGGPRSGYPS